MKRSYQILLSCLCVLSLARLVAQDLDITDPVRFLALGDSYTIGEDVAVTDRWPNQFADALQSMGASIDTTAIIAQTGWTTGNLLAELDQRPPSNDYSLVSLLIGVNNQFQGLGVGDYGEDFRELLDRAISYAQGDTAGVFVLSIPDYAFTPVGQNFSNVTEEIEVFNTVNEAICEEYGIAYFYITDISQLGLAMPELVAQDGLHPSGAMYALWVERILEHINLITSISSRVSTGFDTGVIYPNPARDAIFFKPGVISWLAIYDTNGRLVTAQDLDGSANHLSISDLPAGLYFISAISRSGVMSQPFVKQ